MIDGNDNKIATPAHIAAVIAVILFSPSSAPFWLPKISEGEPRPPIPIVFAGCSKTLKITEIEATNCIIYNKVFKI